MQPTTHVTQHQAADLTGKSYDTVRRLRRQGKLPNSRERSDGVIELAVSDFVETDLLNPLAAAAEAIEAVSRSRTERDLFEARQELALAMNRNDSLTETLARAEGEVAHLRDLLKKAAVA